MRMNSINSLVAVALTYASLGELTTGTVASKPNGIYFAAGDLLRKDFDSNGCSHLETPNLDPLASGHLVACGLGADRIWPVHLLPLSEQVAAEKSNAAKVQKTRVLYSEHAGKLIQHCSPLNTYLGEDRLPTRREVGERVLAWAQSRHCSGGEDSS